MSSMKWDSRYMDLARHVSLWSKDPRKQVGAIITDKQYVRGIGFNGFPRGVEDSEQVLNDKTVKLKLIVHAEVNAILAARGIGDTIYIWPCLPCSQCMGLIIQAGLSRIVTSLAMKNTPTNWSRDIIYDLASQTGVILDFV